MIRTQRGVTLIELMIGLVIGLIVVAISGALFLNTTRSYRQDERFSTLNDDLRYTLGEITRDVELAAFYGTMIDVSLVELGPPGEDLRDGLDPQCGAGSLLDFGLPVDGINEAAPDAIAAAFPCLDGQTLYGGVTDDGVGAFRVNRVAGTALDRASLNARRAANGEPARVFLQTLGTRGGLVITPGNPGTDLTGPLDIDCATAGGDPCRYWEFRSSFYFISADTEPGDGIPCLSRMRIGDGAAPAAVCLVSGAEDLHVEYGVELPNSGGQVFYTTNPSLDDLDRLISMDVHVLLRSPVADASYTNVKTFNLGGKQVSPPADNFYRRVASVSVPMRNLVAQRLNL